MPIQPLQFKAENPNVPQIDFAPLGQLGDIYRKAQMRNELQGLAQNGQQPSLADIAKIALKHGDTETFKGLSQLEQAQAYQSAQIQNMGAQQQIARGQLGIQKQQADEPKYMMSEDANGNKILIKIPKGEASSPTVANPTGGAAVQPNNPYASGGHATGEQSLAGGFSDRMMGAEAVLTGLAPRPNEYGPPMPGVVEQGTSRVNRVIESGKDARFVGQFANQALDPKYRSFAQARDDLINAQLRRESGAAISIPEYADADRRYFPAPGDDAATIAQKNAARKSAIEAMARNAGKSYNPKYVFGDEGKLTKRADAPNAMQPTGGVLRPTPSGLVEEARRAIAAGKDPAGVRAKLQASGFDPSGI